MCQMMTHAPCQICGKLTYILPGQYFGIFCHECSNTPHTYWTDHTNPIPKEGEDTLGPNPDFAKQLEEMLKDITRLEDLSYEDPEWH